MSEECNRCGNTYCKCWFGGPDPCRCERCVKHIRDAFNTYATEVECDYCGVEIGKGWEEHEGYGECEFGAACTKCMEILVKAYKEVVRC